MFLGFWEAFPESHATVLTAKVLVLIEFAFANIFQSFWKPTIGSGRVVCTDAAEGVPNEGAMALLPNRFRSVDTADGGVVLDVETGKMFHLNPTGMRMLTLLQQGIPADRIAEEISRECGVNPQTVCEDLGAFSKSLVERGLLASDR